MSDEILSAFCCPQCGTANFSYRINCTDCLYVFQDGEKDKEPTSAEKFKIKYFVESERLKQEQPILDAEESISSNETYREQRIRQVEQENKNLKKWMSWIAFAIFIYLAIKYGSGTELPF